MRSLCHALCSLLVRHARPARLLLFVSASLVFFSPRQWLQPAQTASNTIVISQVYGGGGNAGPLAAVYRNDYIELYNRGASDVCINGWSVQYAGATSNSWTRVALPNVTIPAGGYLLISGAGGATGAVLPAANVTSTVNLSASAGKVALVNNATALTCGTTTNDCFPNASIVDFVGYGSTANNYEMTAVGTLTNATAAIRKANGATETDNNSADFTVATPAPRASYPALATCIVPTPPTGAGAATPAFVVQGSTALLTVTVTPGANPVSTGLGVVADLTSIGGGAAQAFYDDGTNGDATAGDNIFSWRATIPAATATGVKSLPATITDAQARSGNATIALTVTAPLQPGPIVISQLYGAGGNSGALFTHDYVELFNRTTNTISLTGYSLQYATATGNTWEKVDLSGTLQAGQYYLIQLNSNAAVGSALPASDASASAIALSASAGKLALLSNTTLIPNGTACPLQAGVAGIADFVGYGSSATCFEGSAPASVSSNNSNALFRVNRGCTDTNQNSADFAIATAAPRNTATAFSSCVTTSPMAIGAANPATVLTGASTLLTVTVTPGNNPTSTGLVVTTDLSSIGGATNQTFYDNGTNGDAVAGDGVFSFLATIPTGASAGARTLPVSVTDAQSRTAATSIALTVMLAPTPLLATGAANPLTVVAGNQSLLTVSVTPGANPVSSGIAVMANLTSIGGAAAQTFYDDGTNGDAVAGDNVFSFLATVPAATASGAKTLPSSVSDAQMRTAIASINLTVTPAPTPLVVSGNANPASVHAGNPTLLTLTATPGANPTSSGLTAKADLSSLGLASHQTLFDDGTNGDAMAGDQVFSLLFNVPAAAASGNYTLPAMATDAQARSAMTALTLQVLAAPAAGSIVISQVYGGGGNSGAPFTHDYVELYNRSATPIDLTGWTLNYASSTGGTWQSVMLTGVLSPGRYYLIQLASGGVNGVALPTPDIIGTFGMAATAGKLALLTHGFPLASGTTCPLSAGIGGVMDVVGYGGTANCFEGVAPAPAPSGTLALLRTGNGCRDTNQNSADFFTGAPQPRNRTSATNDCTAGARFVTATTLIHFPATNDGGCVGAGAIITLEAQLTNTGNRAQADNAGDEFTAMPGDALAFLAGDCTSAGGGTCSVNAAGTLLWNGALAVGQTVTLRWQAQVRDGFAANASLCALGTVNYDSDADTQNDAQFAVNGCRVANCPALGVGASYPFSAEVSDQKPGSLLVFPFYSSKLLAPARENTRINLTNTHPARAVAVHLFFIEDDNAQIADSYVCLTPNQTASFLTSDLDPGVSGYLIAIASDERTGCPINFNYLIGDEYVKLESGHAANLGAEAFAALTGAPPVCNAQTGLVEIKFDGVQYNAAPRVLVLDQLPSPADGNATLLVLDRLGGSLADGLSTVGQFFGILYDDQENPYSFEHSTARRQFRQLISNTFPRTAPRVPTLLSAGRSGWLKLWRYSDGALLGVSLNYNARSATQSGAFNQGHNLHKLTLTTAATLEVPVFPPRC